MNPSTTPATTPLRQRMIDDMRMRKLDGKTQTSYIRAVRKLAAFLGRPPDTASVEDLRRFQPFRWKDYPQADAVSPRPQHSRAGIGQP